MKQTIPENRAGQIGSMPYSQKEAAEVLGVKQQTLKAWRESGRIPFAKISRTVFYPRQLVDSMANPTKAQIFYAGRCK